MNIVNYVNTQSIHLMPSLSLIHNNFSFNLLHYPQVKGTTMGTRIAPSYANHFMGSLEEDFLNSEDSKPDLWFRFIDDIFLLWIHGHDSLLLFLECLNSCCPIYVDYLPFPCHRFLMGSSLLPNALRPFKIYCAPLNLGIKMWIYRLNFAQRPIFSVLRFFNEPEIPDFVLKISIDVSRVWTREPWISRRIYWGLV